MAKPAGLGALVPAGAQRGPVTGHGDGAGSTGWTRFRGPNGTGVAPDRGYPATLGPQTLLWRRSMPPGKSSPILTASAIFLTAERKNTPIVLCLDRATGRTLWERSLETSRREPRHPLNHVAAATAVTDGQNVFAFFADYGLVSYASTGRERWRVPLGPFTIGWGSSSSPILVDGAVVIPLDGYVNSYVAAFDQRTGRQRWRAERDAMSHNYSTPILRTGSDGAGEIVVLGPYKLVAYDPRDGRERWVGKVPGGSIVASPAQHGDVVISTNYAVDSYPPFSEWLKTHDKNRDGILQGAEFGGLGPVLGQFAQNHGNRDGAISEDEWIKAYGDLSAGVAGRPVVTALRVRVGDNGTVAPAPLWEHAKNVPNVPSPLVYEGVLYLVATGVIVTTMNIETGDVTKVGRIPGVLGDCYASPVAADGKLFVVSEDGKSAVLRSGAQWDTLSVTELGEQCYATPALSEGRVFIRTADSLFCFAVRQ
jgi:outer membrane protein assembly factor BamB